MPRILIDREHALEVIALCDLCRDLGDRCGLEPQASEYTEINELSDAAHKILAESEDEISVAWHVEDVMMNNGDLSKDEARKVLFLLKKNHDCDHGISSETINIVADIVRSQRAAKGASDGLDVHNKDKDGDL